MATQCERRCACGRLIFGHYLICRVCRLYDSITLGRGPHDA